VSSHLGSNGRCALCLNSSSKTWLVGATLADNFGTIVQSVPDSNLNVTDTAVTRHHGNFALVDEHDDATEYDTWWEGVTVTNCTTEDEAFLYLRGEPDDLVHPRVGSATWRSRTIPAC